MHLHTHTRTHTLKHSTTCLCCKLGRTPGASPRLPLSGLVEFKPLHSRHRICEAAHSFCCGVAPSWGSHHTPFPKDRKRYFLAHSFTSTGMQSCLVLVRLIRGLFFVIPCTSCLRSVLRQHESAAMHRSKAPAGASLRGTHLALFQSAASFPCCGAGQTSLQSGPVRLSVFQRNDHHGKAR